jgi:F0F1-type ATP synthase assembly protein I
VSSTAAGTLEVVITNGELVTVVLVIVTAVLAFAVLCAALLAVTMTWLAVVGAVNNPLEEMLPALADHVTAVLLVLVTEAPN